MKQQRLSTPLVAMRAERRSGREWRASHNLRCPSQASRLLSPLLLLLRPYRQAACIRCTHPSRPRELAADPTLLEARPRLMISSARRSKLERQARRRKRLPRAADGSRPPSAATKTL